MRGDNILRKIFKLQKNNFENIDPESIDPGSKNTNIYIEIFIKVFIIITLICDIMKFTPFYDNPKIKNALDINTGVNYFIWGIVKIYLFITLINIYLDENKNLAELMAEKQEAIDNAMNSGDMYDNTINKIEEIVTILPLIISLCILLFIFISLDIIQFTPLMQNKYINDIVSFNSQGNYMLIMIVKILSLIVPPSIF